jgi:hypothetical protein
VPYRLQAPDPKGEVIAESLKTRGVRTGLAGGVMLEVAATCCPEWEEESADMLNEKKVIAWMFGKVKVVGFGYSRVCL